MPRNTSGDDDLKIRGTNKQKGTRRSWGDQYLANDGNIYRFLYKGNKQKGTRKRKMFRWCTIDKEWFEVGSGWKKCD